jgi:uncharacterized protein (TIGR03435 family)
LILRLSVPALWPADAIPSRPSTPGGRTVVSVNELSLPSFNRALQEHLGLKVESQRVPTRVIVLDRVEKPDVNPH